MIKKTKRFFNTSGPNNPEQHYTLRREQLLETGARLVKNHRYFTIWAPRQSGKTTYFRLLTEELKKDNYRVLHTNFENLNNATEETTLQILSNQFKDQLGLDFKSRTFPLFQEEIKQIKEGNIVLVIDEIEGLNPEILGQFLHTIRSLYHSRDQHSLKSVLLVGVSNITGVIEDNASPFNIADNLSVPYFTNQETAQLLGMHEKETDQRFDDKVKEKITYITGNQPGLVNGFAYQLVERRPEKECIDYNDYLEVEDWYIYKAIDKNISNIISKAKHHRQFVEMLLFNETPVKYRINDDKIKFLTAYGVIKDDRDGNVVFNVPLYKKALMDAFYPFSNGESKLFFRNVNLKEIFYEDNRLDFDILIKNYKEYVKRRSFRYFREKDRETGEYKSIKEAALGYSFETYIQTLVQTLEGKSYLEPHTSLGRCDLLINIHNREYVVEFKIFRDINRFERGKKQLAAYCSGVGIDEGIYLVFVPNTVTLADVREQVETVDNIKIRTYIVHYDEEKDF